MPSLMLDECSYALTAFIQVDNQPKHKINVQLCTIVFTIIYYCKYGNIQKTPFIEQFPKSDAVQSFHH